ncbi:MAG TPA: COX15/CtaA family protein [Anaerolineales bacterium]|nr:COX15/CtaA family protein [Anaerolineales bacterium]
MLKKSNNGQAIILPSHRNLLVAAAVFSTLLIAMGGILCVTQSIRNCPDWPGCFGKVLPPPETGPILEYTHRFLAGVSGLLILSVAAVGMLRVPRLRWISIPPLVALVLLLEVSYFGARVVLYGLAPGWAAVDVGSALLVVALMVTSAVYASRHVKNPGLEDQPSFKSTTTKLLLVTVSVVFVVLFSGVLVAGKGSITGCLGWPIYNLQQFQLDGHLPLNILRLALSIIGVVLLILVLVVSWQRRHKRRDVYDLARWVGLAALLEGLLQILLLVFGLVTGLLLVYTVVAAAFWAFLIGLLVKTSLPVASD